MVKTAHGASVVLGGVTLAGVTNIKVPDMSRGIIPVTDHDTTIAKDFIPEDLYELGDCVITMDYEADSVSDDACLAAMVAAAGSPVAVAIDVKATNGAATVAFDAYGTNYDINDLPAGSTDKQVAVLTLKATGTRGQTS